MTHVRLKYGKTGYDFIRPGHARLLKISPPVCDVQKDGFIKELVQTLPDHHEKLSNIAVVVADKTRLCGYETYLPWLVDSLMSKGVKKENITFYIAYGTHVRQTDEESKKAYGPVYGAFKFVHHNCADESLFTTLGRTKQGTPVRVRKDILEASFLITFGALSHHYFAGYGGGRKLIFPGLGFKDDIYKNHKLFLNLEANKLSAGCQPGNLDGNPLAEDLREFDAYVPQKISIHGILDGQGKVANLKIGSDYDDFLKAAVQLDSFYKYGKSQKYDLVVASCGGFPKDINFIQAHKAIDNAARFVKDNGVLIVLCECKDGLGSATFLPYFESGDFTKAFGILEKDYKGNGGTALSMMTKTKRIKIFLKTELDDNTCSTIKVRKIENNEIEKMIQNAKPGVAFIENASLLII